MADDIMNKDLYKLLNAEVTATVKEIKTAYRKKALSCHPDKNPDNPQAAELFHELSRALEILTDASARAAYDKILHAREQAKIRVRQLDSKRRKFKEDLEAREEAFRVGQSQQKAEEAQLKAEIERLRKEGSKQVEEEEEYVRQKIREQLGRAGNLPNSTESARVKIKWKAAKDDEDNGGYNYDILHQILSKHGDISALVVSSAKKGRGLVEYKDKRDAQTAVDIEIGLIKNPLSLQGLWPTENCKRPAANTSSTNLKYDSPIFPTTGRDSTAPSTFLSFSSAPNIFAARDEKSDTDYENEVLGNLRRAEERRRLIEQMKADEEPV